MGEAQSVTIMCPHIHHSLEVYQVRYVDIWLVGEQVIGWIKIDDGHLRWNARGGKGERLQQVHIVQICV